MKALSVKQPWAELIASGRKTVETRSMRTGYRGPLAIHASLHADEAAMDRFGLHDLPAGRIVATTTLADCRPFGEREVEAACTPWRPTAWAWLLRDVRRCDSILPVRGQLGLWECPDALLLQTAKAQK